MKKFLVYIFFTLSLATILCRPVLAQPDVGAEINKQLGAAGAEAGYDAPTDPRVTVGNIIRVVLGLIGTIFMALTIYAGFLWMTAAGNDDQVGKAKSLLYQAVIGLIVILTAYGITVLAMKIATGSGYTDSNGVIQYTSPPLKPACEGQSCP